MRRKILYRDVIVNDLFRSFERSMRLNDSKNSRCEGMKRRTECQHTYTSLTHQHTQCTHTYTHTLRTKNAYWKKVGNFAYILSLSLSRYTRVAMILCFIFFSVSRLSLQYLGPEQFISDYSNGKPNNIITTTITYITYTKKNAFFSLYFLFFKLLFCFIISFWLFAACLRSKVLSDAFASNENSPLTHRAHTYLKRVRDG